MPNLVQYGIWNDMWKMTCNAANVCWTSLNIYLFLPKDTLICSTVSHLITLNFIFGDKYRYQDLYYPPPKKPHLLLPWELTQHCLQGTYWCFPGVECLPQTWKVQNALTCAEISRQGYKKQKQCLFHSLSASLWWPWIRERKNGFWNTAFSFLKHHMKQ